jgi:hypothetical protein
MAALIWAITESTVGLLQTYNYSSKTLQEIKHSLPGVGPRVLTLSTFGTVFLADITGRYLLEKVSMHQFGRGLVTNSGLNEIQASIRIEVVRYLREVAQNG